MHETNVTHRKLRVFLVEDHNIMRHGLASLLKTELDVDIVGEAADGITAMERLQSCHPDVILMDIAMPRMNGIEATRRIRNKFPGPFILMLSMYNNPSLVNQSLQAGASGFILKDSMIEELSEALYTVVSGGIFISSQVSGPFKEIPPSQIQSFALTEEEELTNREYEILQSLANGKTVSQIAEELCVSIYTIYTHQSNIKRKLKLKNQAEIIRYAVHHDIITQ